jgi:hypothetical protein
LAVETFYFKVVRIDDKPAGRSHRLAGAQAHNRLVEQTLTQLQHMYSIARIPLIFKSVVKNKKVLR